jgi:hypothetical protein
MTTATSSSSASAANASVGLTGATAPTSATEIGFISSGNLVAASAANPLPITGTLIAGPNYFSPGLQTITTPTGTAVIACQSFTTIALELYGTYGIATLVFEEQFDTASTNWYPCFGTPVTNTLATTPVSGVTTSANQSLSYQFTVGAAINFRVRATALASGTLNVFLAETTDNLQYGQSIAISNTVTTNTAQIGGTTIVNGGVAGSQSVGGTVATNVAITDNPLNMGAQAVSSENTAVTTARKVQLVADLVGKLITMPYANKENVVFGNATTTGTSDTSVIAAGAGSLKNYVTGGTVYNSGATTATITVKNGSGGTTLFTTIAPAGGGSNFTLPTPVPTSAATAVYFAAGSSSTTIGISLTGYIGT